MYPNSSEQISLEHYQEGHKISIFEEKGLEIDSHFQHSILSLPPLFRRLEVEIFYFVRAKSLSSLTLQLDIFYCISLF